MPKEQTLEKGLIDCIGESGGKIANHKEALRVLLAKISGIDAIGHRVVHGAEWFRQPTIITASVLKKIKKCAKLAHLHNPANVAGIEACQHVLPGIRQVAVFDTAFYQTMPDYAYIYGLPYKLYSRHRVRRYGFHGTSHEYVAEEAAKKLKKPLKALKLITCHLGNGCSITAVKNGRAVDTSMGFTPLEGLLMGTRTGDLDPAIVLFLQQQLHLSPSSVETILNRESGLKGVSGISNDMRKLFAAYRKGNPRARLAINIFVYRIRKYIGSYLAVLGGADALIFTAGIGEHQRGITAKICRGLFAYLKKRPEVLIVPTDEELMIARQAYKLVR